MSTKVAKNSHPRGLTYYWKDKIIKCLESVSVWVCNSWKVVAKTQMDDT
jgi:hypothetical protein